MVRIDKNHRICFSVPPVGPVQFEAFNGRSQFEAGGASKCDSPILGRYFEADLKPDSNGLQMRFPNTGTVFERRVKPI